MSGAIVWGDANDYGDPFAPWGDPVETATVGANLSCATWNDHGLRSHLRIAARFAQHAEGKCIYVDGTGWHYWDGTRWALDRRNAHAHAALEDLIRISWAEAIGDPALQADVKASQTGTGFRSVLDLASSQMLVLDVDSNPDLLNCPNGTLDLGTLELRPHAPADYITKITGCNFAPDATSADWERFLASSLPNGDVRGFLQRFIGSALFGRVIDHVLVIATGEGRNGKGVIARAVSAALGDYAITASNEMLVTGRHGGKSAGELASQMRLRGARFAVMSELEQGATLAEATMKHLTGGDPVEAKNMGQNPVQFEPSHSFLMLTNDLPKVNAGSKAVWARVRVVPFRVSFEGREDHDLEPRIHRALPAVLSWAVAGLRSYKDFGLAAPVEVLTAGEEYRAESDTFTDFLEEKCTLGPNEYVTSNDMATAYSVWAHHRQQPQLATKDLAARLTKVQGVSRSRSRAVRGWSGIGLAGLAGLAS